MKILEMGLRSKAGVVPYYIDEAGVAFMMFMVPSDTAYGGPQFQVAKGKVEQGEDIQSAAVREGHEELGLEPNNIAGIKHVSTEVITGYDDTYNLAIFAVKIKDPKAFGQPHYETGKRGWLTLEQFARKGRRSQLGIVQKVAKAILAAGGQKEVS